MQKLYNRRSHHHRFCNGNHIQIACVYSVWLNRTWKKQLRDSHTCGTSYLLRVLSSVGQSTRLLIWGSRVRIPEFPPYSTEFVSALFLPNAGCLVIQNTNNPPSHEDTYNTVGWPRGLRRWSWKPLYGNVPWVQIPLPPPLISFINIMMPVPFRLLTWCW